MANNNIEQYLEAMLAALDGDPVPDVPSPSWNIEKYLAAILTKLSSGGSGGGGNIEVVNVAFTPGEGSDEWTCTIDKTFAELVAMVNAGKKILAYTMYGRAVGTPAFIDSDGDTTYLEGNTIITTGGGIYNDFHFSIDADGSYVDDVFEWTI
jgi:hypothetical protein